MINYPLVLLFVAFFIAVSIYITYITNKSAQSAADFYVGGNKIPWVQTGIAMIGSYLSAASFLGVAGDISVKGVDRIWLAIGFFGGYMAVLMLIAGPLRNVGSYTVADALYRRFPDRMIKLITMITVVIISTFYLVPQLVAAGKLFELILGWNFLLVTIGTGVLISIYIIFGGMKATLYNQVIQALFLWIAMVFIVVFAIVMYYGGNINAIFEAAAGVVPPIMAGADPNIALAIAGKTSEEAILIVRNLMVGAPSAMTIGLQTPDILSQVSTVVALLFGTAGLPHILIMFYTVPSAKAAKKSVTLCIVGLGIFYLFSLILGFICMNLAYPQLVTWIAGGKMGLAVNMAVLEISRIIGGQFLMAISAAGAVAAILSTAAGLMITVASTISHDFYKTFINANASERQELNIAKITTFAMSTVAVVLSLILKNENVAWLVTLAFGISASAIFPIMLASLWWKRFTKEAAISGMLVGLIVSIFFIILLQSGVKTFLGLSTLGGPGIFGVACSVITVIVVSFFTNNTGHNVEEFFDLAHKEDLD